MSASVAALLAGAQHSAFSALSSRLGKPYEGLSAAAREAKRQGVITAAMAKKCERLDVAAHWARHCTAQKCDHFVQQLVQAIDHTTGDFSASLVPATEESAASVAASEQVGAADAEPWLVNVTDAEILAQVTDGAEVEDSDVHHILPHALAHEHADVDIAQATGGPPAPCAQNSVLSQLNLPPGRSEATTEEDSAAPAGASAPGTVPPASHIQAMIALRGNRSDEVFLALSEMFRSFNRGADPKRVEHCALAFAAVIPRSILVQALRARALECQFKHGRPKSFRVQLLSMGVTTTAYEQAVALSETYSAAPAAVA